jgi:hypothetical protein
MNTILNPDATTPIEDGDDDNDENLAYPEKTDLCEEAMDCCNNMWGHLVVEEQYEERKAHPDPARLAQIESLIGQCGIDVKSIRVENVANSRHIIDKYTRLFEEEKARKVLEQLRVEAEQEPSSPAP